jgi:hypothetical protein
MSDEAIDSRQSEGAPLAYEPPRVTPLGNVRDLLAGGEGTVDDGDPDAPKRPV